MERREEGDGSSISDLADRADKLIEILAGKGDQRSVEVKVDNRVDNRRTERAAWACGIACAVCLTIAIMQALQLYALQAKYDRMQDYLNFIYQQAPYLRKPEQSK